MRKNVQTHTKQNILLGKLWKSSVRSHIQEAIDYCHRIGFQSILTAFHFSLHFSFSIENENTGLLCIVVVRRVSVCLWFLFRFVQLLFVISFFFHLSKRFDINFNFYLLMWLRRHGHSHSELLKNA